jgi:hypothetical protein
MQEPFQRGELVTLRQHAAATDPIGRVVAVTGEQAEVAWTRYPGHDNEVTVEPTVALRRVHESELSAADC